MYIQTTGTTKWNPKCFGELEDYGQRKYSTDHPNHSQRGEDCQHSLQSKAYLQRRRIPCRYPDRLGSHENFTRRKGSSAADLMQFYAACTRSERKICLPL